MRSVRVSRNDSEWLEIDDGVKRRTTLHPLYHPKLYLCRIHPPHFTICSCTFDASTDLTLPSEPCLNLMPSPLDCHGYEARNVEAMHTCRHSPWSAGKRPQRRQKRNRSYDWWGKQCQGLCSHAEPAFRARNASAAAAAAAAPCLEIPSLVWI